MVMDEVIRMHGHSDGYFGTVCRFEIEEAGRIARPALFCRITQHAAAERDMGRSARQLSFFVGNARCNLNGCG
jgi:hypothetical protein